MTDKVPVITIDGPSGCGKGAVSQLVAKRLGFKLLDSGVLYRAAAKAAQAHSVDFSNDKALEVLARYLDVQFVLTEPGLPPRILLEGEDVTDVIRTERLGEKASQVAAIPGVREALLARQRAFQELPGLVADGRDMGTVVFPDAFLKIYLDAGVEVRAKRRFDQLKELGLDVSLQSVLEEIRWRDERDKTRSIAPLRPASEAVLIDTSEMTIEEVYQCVMHEVRERLSESLKTT